MPRILPSLDHILTNIQYLDGELKLSTSTNQTITAYSKLDNNGDWKISNADHDTFLGQFWAIDDSNYDSSTNLNTDNILAAGKPLYSKNTYNITTSFSSNTNPNGIKLNSLKLTGMVGFRVYSKVKGSHTSSTRSTAYNLLRTDMKADATTITIYVTLKLTLYPSGNTKTIGNSIPVVVAGTPRDAARHLTISHPDKYLSPAATLESFVDGNVKSTTFPTVIFVLLGRRH